MNKYQYFGQARMEFPVKKRKVLTTAAANKHRFAVKVW